MVADAFDTVRLVAEDDLRAVTAVRPGCASVRAALIALDAATTTDEVIALEHLVVAAWCELRLTVADDRLVHIGDRWVPWDQLGCYRGVVEAATRVSAAGR